ncbi:acylphosphatase [Jatrophihabitans sp. GAS493]|uniref:acylphosphatase n=1 Tax=Jatrophihabitans sp. GAS493 TaxID=1907575 RepID=UPI000BB6CD09|nr:acylphosphatase [Jatrophihabitans sp. GAS493]SOD70996.1 acylphosphatase [Jatrophihabitans sp. GAS493]
MQPVRLEVLVSGDVQGVGFRWWTRSQAVALGLQGSARNLADGRVAIVAVGPAEKCQQLLDSLGLSDAPGRVRSVDPTWAEVGADGDVPPGFVTG